MYNLLVMFASLIDLCCYQELFAETSDSCWRNKKWQSHVKFFSIRPGFMWLNVIYAKLYWKPMWSAVSSSSVCDLWGDRRGLLLILWLTLHLVLEFLSWSLQICCLRLNYTYFYHKWAPRIPYFSDTFFSHKSFNWMVSPWTVESVSQSII